MINQKGDAVAQNYFRFLQGFMDYTDSDLVAMAAAGTVFALHSV